jgi:ribosomal protein L7/L12
MTDADIFALQLRVADLERRMLALDGGGPPETAPAVDPVYQSLLSSGNKIEAIKRYREQTGAGLAEAKHHVEEMERGLGL